MTSVPDILKKIVDHKHEEVAAARANFPDERLVDQLAQVEEPPRGFLRALRATAESGWTAASPGTGLRQRLSSEKNRCPGGLVLSPAMVLPPWC